MAKETYVVATTESAAILYLTGYNLADPPASTFGNLENAVEFETQEGANELAANIGGGTAGTPKP